MGMDLLQSSTPAALLGRIVAGGADHGLQPEWQIAGGSRRSMDFQMPPDSPDCPRRPNFDPPCRLNFDPGLVAEIA